MLRPSVFADWHSSKLVRLLPSHRDWEVGAPCFLVVTFQRDTSQALRNNSWVVKLTRGWEEIYTSKGQRRIYT